jgi:hypothetical protein
MSPQNQGFRADWEDCTLASFVPGLGVCRNCSKSEYLSAEGLPLRAAGRGNRCNETHAGRFTCTSRFYPVASRTFVSRELYGPSLVPLSSSCVHKENKCPHPLLEANVYTRKDKGLLAGFSTAPYALRLSAVGVSPAKRARRVSTPNEGRERRDGGQRSEKKSQAISNQRTGLLRLGCAERSYGTGCWDESGYQRTRSLCICPKESTCRSHGECPDWISRSARNKPSTPAGSQRRSGAPRSPLGSHSTVRVCGGWKNKSVEREAEGQRCLRGPRRIRT